MVKIISERNKSDEVITSMLGEPNFRKVLKQKRSAGEGVLLDVLMEIGFPIDSFNQSKLSEIPMSHTIWADEVNQLISLKDYAKAAALLDRVEHEMSKIKLSRQEFLLLKAILFNAENKPANEVLDIIKEAIAITFPSYTDEVVGEASFVIHEPDLIYNKAVALSRLEKFDESISILISLIKSLNLHAMTERQKDKTLSPIYLTLCNLLYITGSYEELFKYAEEGCILTVEVSSGRYVPYFKFLEAKATLKTTGKPETCTSLLMEAYSSFLLSAEIEKANEVLECARNDFGLELELYGAEKLHDLFDQAPKIQSRGFAVECKNASELIKALSNKKGIQSNMVYGGIMTQPSYSNVMAGKSNFNYLNLEAMSQRLGIDISIYDNYLLGITDYQVIELRNEILKKVVLFDFDGLTSHTNELLKQNKKLKSKVIMQFIEYALVKMSYYNEEIDLNEYRKQLKEILEITLSNFDESNFRHRHLTQTEIRIINQYGSSYDENKYMQGANIIDQLLYIHNRDYTDEVEGDRTLGMLYLNYSSLVGLAGNAHEAFTIAKEGLNIELSRKSLISSHGFTFNMAYSLMEKNTTEALPYFILSYYSAKSMAPCHNWCKSCAEATASTVSEKYGISLI